MRPGRGQRLVHNDGQCAQHRRGQPALVSGAAPALSGVRPARASLAGTAVAHTPARQPDGPGAHDPKGGEHDGERQHAQERGQHHGDPRHRRHRRDAHVHALARDGQQLAHDGARVLRHKHGGDAGVGVRARLGHDDERLGHVVVHDGGHRARGLRETHLDVKGAVEGGCGPQRRLVARDESHPGQAALLKRERGARVLGVGEPQHAVYPLIWNIRSEVCWQV
mmetsp:Transcript_22868/g.58294  ORF Transcript_22868/g.58294 Transcript_22868/m.58294 type:complete len:223 (+) Transcript_22868:1774-2442(+)